MLNKASIVVSEAYQGNKLFDLENKHLNRDDCLYSFSLLRESLFKRGFDLSTSDIYTPSESLVVIYNEMPSLENLPTGDEIKKSYLLLFESELIRPDNWELVRHKFFKKIFTWDDRFVDNIKYFKINFSFKLDNINSSFIGEAKKLCTLISGNKMVKHPLELYSKRVEAIRWFENNHPGDFDLYGFGWDEYQFTGPKIFRLLNRVKPLTKFLAPSFSSYKGRIDEKKEVLEEYKFAICYENAKDIPGYITEKIFDCFIAGCVPIYWGANNIANYIPSNCYIDKTKFDNYESLYQFIRSMNDTDYDRYRNNIRNFVNSERASPFTSQYFSETISSCICEDYDKP